MNRSGPKFKVHPFVFQKRLKRGLEVFREAASEKILQEVGRERARGLLPLSKIIDEPAFQEKSGSSILQIADFCAFAFKRAIRRQTDYERFAKPLAPATLRWNMVSEEPAIIGPSWGWA
jgi:hypothetical protein